VGREMLVNQPKSWVWVD